MAKLPRNLPALLRSAGLNVVVVDGWYDRGRPASTGGFAPQGVLNHHTGASAKGWTLAKELDYAKWMFLTGRPKDGLPAPLVQIALGRSGTVYVGAAGRANHAGKAKSSGTVAAGDGNELYVGIEWMLSGTERIPAAMMKAGITLNAVLTEKVVDAGRGNSVNTISCHYQTSVTGKWDIGDPDGIPFNGKRVLDMVKFRALVRTERARLFPPVTAPAAPKPAAKSTTIRVATNNIMSLPPNPEPRKTLRAAPLASVVMLQEANLPKVQAILRSLPGSKHKRITHTVPNSQSYASFVLYHPRVWEHVSTEFFKAYSGRKHISLTRHIAVTVLRNKAIDQEFAFIAYHAVTGGMDRIRVLLRREGDAVVRKQRRRFRDAGIPVFIGADQNRKHRVFTQSTLYVRNWLDALYAWNGKHVTLRMNSHHTVPTRSDHDVLVAEYTATVK